MLASLDRHLREKDAAFSIAKDIEFSNSRTVLKGKERLLRQEGFGKKYASQNKRMALQKISHVTV